MNQLQIEKLAMSQKLSISILCKTNLLNLLTLVVFVHTDRQKRKLKEFFTPNKKKKLQVTVSEAACCIIFWSSYSQ